MPLPSIVKTWSISTNNRIVFVSLNDTMANYLLGVKNFLKNTGGYTVKGSSNGTTAAMDGTDRWITSANAATRNSASGAAQSWFVFTDGNGCDLLLTYQGSTDDVARISYSIGGLFVAAGTAVNQPTATDEAVISSAISLINNTTSLDRIWFGWVDSTKKLCRFQISRNGAFTGIVWGLELTSPVISGAVVVWTPAVWGFGAAAATSNIVLGNVSGVARVTAGSAGTTCSIKYGIEVFGNSFTTWGNTKLELQGGKEYPAFPISIASVTTGARGKFANLFDTWLGRTTGGDEGTVYGQGTHIGVSGLHNGTGSTLWPWNNTSPVLI